MKKILFIGLCLLGTAHNVSAQLKVANNGRVYMKGDYDAGNTFVNVGELADSMTLPNSIYSMGLRSLFPNTIPNTHAAALFGESRQMTTAPYRSCMGVWGVGGGGRVGANYGVAGTLHTGRWGAGIYGANQDNAFFTLLYDFAGFFYGQVCVEGWISTTVGVYNTSDMRLKRNVERIADKEWKTGSTLDKLSSLDVLEYNVRTPLQDAIAEMPDSMKPTGKDPNPDIRHFGVSAQELQKLYPDLVREGEDGYLSVNYVEMVPLLLRSMQELKARVQELEGKDDIDGGPAARRESRLSNSADSRVSPVSATLYQNTPNPFSAQTDIRFSLPDDAPQAYIYIFDMTGKMQKQIPVDPSQQSVTINGYELSAGIYLYSLVVGGQEIDTKRMILSK